MLLTAITDSGASSHEIAPRCFRAGRHTRHGIGTDRRHRRRGHADRTGGGGEETAPGYDEVVEGGARGSSWIRPRQVLALELPGRGLRHARSGADQGGEGGAPDERRL